MTTYLYEVIKEYVLIVEDLNHSVRGRITKLIKKSEAEEFHWDISHNYSPSESAGIYYPSKKTTSLFDETEFLLLEYMKGFTKIDVTPNQHY